MIMILARIITSQCFDIVFRLFNNKNNNETGLLSSLALQKIIRQPSPSHFHMTHLIRLVGAADGLDWGRCRFRRVRGQDLCIGAWNDREDRATSMKSWSLFLLDSLVHALSASEHGIGGFQTDTYTYNYYDHDIAFISFILLVYFTK